MSDSPCWNCPRYLISLVSAIVIAVIVPGPVNAFCDFDYVCGDGIHVPQCEECDDGNRVPGDGCDANCRLEGV